MSLTPQQRHRAIFNLCFIVLFLGLGAIVSLYWWPPALILVGLGVMAGFTGK